MCKASKSMATIIYVDFNKASDSNDRRAIAIVLSICGISQLLVANAMQFHIRTSAGVGMRAMRAFNVSNNI